MKLTPNVYSNKIFHECVTSFAYDSLMKLELTAEMEERITGPDVGEEGIAKTLTLGGPLHKTGNIHNVEESRNFAERRGSSLTIKLPYVSGIY